MFALGDIPLSSSSASGEAAVKKRKFSSTLDSGADGEEEHYWLIKRAQWRIEIQQQTGSEGDVAEVMLCAVKIDAVSGDRGRNRARGFLVG